MIRPLLLLILAAALPAAPLPAEAASFRAAPIRASIRASSGAPRSAPPKPPAARSAIEARRAVAPAPAASARREAPAPAPMSTGTALALGGLFGWLIAADAPERAARPPVRRRPRLRTRRRRADMVEADFLAHVATGCTTRALCWRLERGDGATYGFSDHDEPLTFGGLTYEARAALAGSD